MDLKIIKKIEPGSSFKLSVIIPFYGSINDLRMCLKGLKEQDFQDPFEIIVIESGNNPEVEQLVTSVLNSILITSSSILFPGNARNVGVEHSGSDLLAFTDADCVPSSNWISEIYKGFNSGYDIVAGPIINLFPFHPIASVDNLLQFVDFQKYQTSKNISHFPGCNFGITKELFNRAGGFISKYRMGSDVKFSQSAIKNCSSGILFNRKMIVRHSGRKIFKQFVRHNEQFGFYRGYLGLKISENKSNFRSSIIYSVFFGFKRFIYITIRTISWNPAGILRIIFFSPLIIIGLSAWVNGFRRGNKKLLEGIN